MISTLVQLLIAFPKLGELLMDIRYEYVKELNKRRYNKHATRIDDWVRNDKEESDS